MAAQMNIADMCSEIGADSLAFVSIDGLYRAMGEAGRNGDTPQFCDACFTGDYPVKETFFSFLIDLVNCSMSDLHPDLSGKVILITGASRGIGRSVALACAKAGAEVIITGRTMGALEELDDEINASGGSATIVELDQTDTAAMARLGQAIGARWGRLDGFVANAGQLGQMAPMPHIDPEIFEEPLWSMSPLSGIRLRHLTGCSALLRLGVLYWCPVAQHMGSGPIGAHMLYPKPGWKRWAGPGPLRVRKQQICALTCWTRGNPHRDAGSSISGEDPNNLPTADDIAPAFLQLLSPDCDSQGKRYLATDLIQQPG